MGGGALPGETNGELGEGVGWHAFRMRETRVMKAQGRFLVVVWWCFSDRAAQAQSLPAAKPEEVASSLRAARQGSTARWRKADIENGVDPPAVCCPRRGTGRSRKCCETIGMLTPRPRQP